MDIMVFVNDLFLVEVNNNNGFQKSHWDGLYRVL